MSEMWWDRDGNQWQTWGGEIQIVGYDESKKISRMPEEEAEFQAIMNERDEWNASRPPEPARNILYDFITGLQAEIEFSVMIEKASGKDTKI